MGKENNSPLEKAIERYVHYVSIEKVSKDIKFKLIEGLWDDECLRFCFIPSDTSQEKRGVYINFDRESYKSSNDISFLFPIAIIPYQLADLINIQKYFDRLDEINTHIHKEKNRSEIYKSYDNSMCHILQSFSKEIEEREINCGDNNGYIYHVIDNNCPNEGRNIEEWERLEIPDNRVIKYYNSNLENKDCMSEETNKIIDAISKKFSEEGGYFQEFLVIDIYLSKVCSGIDIVNRFRKANERNKQNDCIPIIIVSKHFSDHTVADALLLSKADWFISKGLIIVNSGKIEKLKELHIISSFLNGVRYREYLIYFLLFLKFKIFHLYLKDNDSNHDTYTKGLKNINVFISWIEGENGDFPKHKPHFVTCLANNINKKIIEITKIIEEQIEQNVKIPKEVLQSWINEVYIILENQVETRREWIDLKISENDKSNLCIPLNGGEIKREEILSLLELNNIIDITIKYKTEKDSYLYLIWQKLLADIIDNNIRWK